MVVPRGFLGPSLSFVGICGAGGILLKSEFGTDGHSITRGQIMDFVRRVLTEDGYTDRDRGNAAMLAWILVHRYPDVEAFVAARELRCSHTGVVLMSTLLAAIFSTFPRCTVAVDIGTAEIKVSPAPVIVGTESTGGFKLDAGEFTALFASDPTKAMEWLDSALGARGVDLARAVIVGTAAVRAAIRVGTTGASPPTTSVPAGDADPLRLAFEASAVKVGKFPPIFVISGGTEALAVDRVARAAMVETGAGAGGTCVGTVAYGGGSCQGTLGDGSTWTLDCGVKRATASMKDRITATDADDDIVGTAAAAVDAMTWTAPSAVDA